MEGGKRRAVDAAAANTVRNHQIDGVTGAFFVVQRLGKDGVGRKLTAGLEAMTGAELLDATGQLGIANAVQGCGTRDDAHADRHAVAVSQLKVLAGLDGMSGAVSKLRSLRWLVSRSSATTTARLMSILRAIMSATRATSRFSSSSVSGVFSSSAKSSGSAITACLTTSPQRRRTALGAVRVARSHVSDDNTWLPKAQLGSCRQPGRWPSCRPPTSPP